MSIRGPKLKYIAVGIALFCIILGAYLNFFHSRGFVKTTGTIVAVEEMEPVKDDEAPTYLPTIEYEVNGVTYTEQLDMAGSNYEVGKTIAVQYDPQNPKVVHSAEAFPIYIMIIGIAILAFVIIHTILAKKNQKKLQEKLEKRGWVGYEPSVQGEERELYFITDVGTPKYGHRLEDGNRAIRYEAKMTKFSLTQDYEFDFIDHEHGTVTPHLVGHETESQWDTLLIDNHYTFDLDGMDVWKHLRDCGIRVESSYAGTDQILGVTYTIYRDGVEIGRAVTTSMYPHEEDAAEHKIADKITVRGFYRVWTREVNLDLLFMTLVAFARSGANDDQGGNYQAIFNTFKKGLNG